VNGTDRIGERLRCAKFLRAKADDYIASAKLLIAENEPDITRAAALLDGAIALNLAAAEVAGWPE
jgi:hypothetical protein